MQDRSIALIWIGGLILTILVYLVGSQHILLALDLFFDSIAQNIGIFLHNLAWISSGFVQAGAIGFYVTFLVLSLIAINRGIQAKKTLVLLTIAWLFCVPLHSDRGNVADWALAFILAFVGSVAITLRIRKSNEILERAGKRQHSFCLNEGADQ